MAANNSRNLRIRVKPYLADLKARVTTNRAVAAELECSEEALCRVLAEVGLQKDPAIDRKAQTALNKERVAFRTALANDPSITPTEAAKRAGCSLRTIYRYIGK